MKKIILGIINILFLLIAKPILADTSFNLSVTTTPFNQLSVMIDGYPWPSEVSPIFFLNPGGQKVYIFPGGSSHLCYSNVNMLNSNVLLNPSACRIYATYPSIFQPNGLFLDWKNPANVVTVPWEFSYNGIFGTAVLPSQNRVFFSKHFEVQNYVYRYVYNNTRDCTNPSQSYVYQGPFHEDIKADYCTCEQQNVNCADPNNSYGKNPLCVEGNNICPADLSDANHDHSYPSMASGITMAWADYLPQNGYQITSPVNDEGPIIWPMYGYRINGKNAYRDPGYGLPIVWNDYLYLFYVTPKVGQAGCVAVSRSPVSGKGLPGTWKNYYNGLFNENSLPAGFDKNRIKDFYSVPGGQAECIIKDERDDAATWFFVARIKNTPYFIAAEETSPHYATYKMGFRFSRDLVHWSPMHLVETAATKWGEGNYTYPRFLSKDGSSNSEIDPDEFYLYGKKVGNDGNLNGGYIIQSMKLSLVLKPPADKIDPMIRQYFREILGRDDPSPSPWHQNIMNQSGCTGVIKDFVFSTEFSNGRKKNTSNEEYIRMLFRGILSRDIDNTNAGMIWYLNKLQSGVTRDAVADEIMSEQEANDVCIGGNLISTPTPTSTPTPLSGDLDKNGKVNISDYNLFVGNFGNTTCGNLADIDGNCKVDIFDYNILVGNFGK